MATHHLGPFRLIVAPFVRDARRFIRESGYHPWECRIATDLMGLRGYSFRAQPGRPPNNGWEVWFLGSHWPLATRRDIDRYNEIYAYLRYVQGADIRHWYT
jgi:hypothetical protein